MAIIHGQESWYMRVNIKAARVAAILFFAIFVIGAIRMYYVYVTRVTDHPVLNFLALIISLGVLYFITTRNTNTAVKDYWHNLTGLRSENTALLELQQLPDNYHIFRNVQFTDGYDIDFVVVGPRGVFVLEVNSTRGDVSANGDTLLINGKPMNGKNRIKQALRNTMEVSEYLDGKYFVQGAVIFAHYRTKLNIGFRKVGGVFVVKHQWLTKLILEESDDQHLPLDQVEYIIKKLLLTIPG